MSIPCKVCQSGWRILNGEEFCGWCGSPTIGFDLLFEEGVPPLLYADELPEIISVPLVLLNKGILEITIEKPEVVGVI